MSSDFEYRFLSSEVRGQSGRFEIATRKSLVDDATSGYGPMLDEVKATPNTRMLERKYDGEGGVTMWFDLDMLGRGWKGQPADRAERALLLVRQLDAVAARHDAADPRITLGETVFSAQRREFRVSFAQPTSDKPTTAAAIQAGMMRAASLVRLHPTRLSDDEEISATYSDDAGFLLSTRALSGRADLETDHAVIPEEGRVELTGNNVRSYYPGERHGHGRLIAFIGIVSALDPPLD